MSQDTSRLPDNKGSANDSQVTQNKGSDNQVTEAPIVTDFGTFKTKEELIAKAAEINGNYSNLANNYNQLLDKYDSFVTSHGAGKVVDTGDKNELPQEPDWDKLEEEGIVPSVIKTMKQMYSEQKKAYSSLVDKAKVLEQNQNYALRSSDAQALTIARATPGFIENEKDVNEFLKGIPASDLALALSKYNSKYKNFAGNNYLAGFELWKLTTDKGQEYDRNNRADTGVPSSSSKSKPVIVSDEEKGEFKKMGLTDEQIQRIEKRRELKAKEAGRGVK